MADKVTCPRCGRSTPSGTFCQYCGRSLYSCSACGAKLTKDALFCPECGIAVPKGKKILAAERTSWAWWLLPLSLFWIGGTIAWSLNRYRDPGKATSMLWLGISLTVIEIIVGVILRFTGT